MWLGAKGSSNPPPSKPRKNTPPRPSGKLIGPFDLGSCESLLTEYASLVNLCDGLGGAFFMGFARGWVRASLGAPPQPPPLTPQGRTKTWPTPTPDPRESSHTPRGSIPPMGHHGGALGQGSDQLHCSEPSVGPRWPPPVPAAFSDHTSEHGRFHSNLRARSRLLHP